MFTCASYASKHELICKYTQRVVKICFAFSSMQHMGPSLALCFSVLCWICYIIMTKPPPNQSSYENGISSCTFFLSAIILYTLINIFAMIIIKHWLIRISRILEETNYKTLIKQQKQFQLSVISLHTASMILTFFCLILRQTIDCNYFY